MCLGRATPQGLLSLNLGLGSGSGPGSVSKVHILGVDFFFFLSVTLISPMSLNGLQAILKGVVVSDLSFE